MTLPDQFRRFRWYVVVNDEVGGWAISNVDRPTSEVRSLNGEWVFADFISRELAEYVANLHNRSRELSL